MRFEVDSNSPDCEIAASSPAYATSFDGLENLEISPISPRITAPVIGPIPGIEVIGELIFSINIDISSSTVIT